MQKVISAFLKNKKLGRKVEYKNLTIYPIFSKTSCDSDFLTIDEALEKNYVDITEMSEIGDVPNLRLKNLSDHKLFILDGEELIGAKQNRVTNSVVLAPARDELTIPVSCVERTRWNYKTKRFSSGHTRVYFRLRKKIFQTELTNKERTVKAHPQHDVWCDIDNKISNMGVESTTSAMNDIYKKYVAQLEKFNQKLSGEDGQVGMVVIINNKVVSCEIFSNHNVMEKLYHKILNSYTIDALEDSKKEKKKLKTIRRKALNFLTHIKKSKFNESNSVGLGTEIYFDSDKVCGKALHFENDIVYMSVYSKVYI